LNGVSVDHSGLFGNPAQQTGGISQVDEARRNAETRDLMSQQRERAPIQGFVGDDLIAGFQQRSQNSHRLEPKRIIMCDLGNPIEMTLNPNFLRVQSGMTLEQLATDSGLTRSYLSKFERGLSSPSIGWSVGRGAVLADRAAIDPASDGPSPSDPPPMHRRRPTCASVTSRTSRFPEPLDKDTVIIRRLRVPSFGYGQSTFLEPTTPALAHPALRG